MPTRLYLDTARLGLMTRSAQQVSIDFVRFAGEEASTLYFEQFLRTGTICWPDSLRSRFPALEAWRGISHLKEGLKRLAGAAPESEVLLANRSAQLMKLAARLLFRRCRNVLVTDLNWPSYQSILQRERAKGSNGLTCVRLRRPILLQRISESEVIDRLVETFVHRGCDGLFLPMVDNLGVRLPVEKIVRAIERQATLRFVVIDGAQAFCHVPVALAREYCDFFIAGCHKWLGAYHPLGLGFYSRRRSSSYIETTRKRMTNSGELDDPLLKFSDELQGGPPAPFGETVSVSPLFSCQGAVNDALSLHTPLEDVVTRQIDNANALASLLHNTGWSLLAPQPAFRSGVSLYRPTRLQLRRAPVEFLRTGFHQAGIALTAYKGGILRIALPPVQWESRQLACLQHGFASFWQDAQPHILH